MATTQAYFENIQFQIIKELQSAKNSIKIAVAWFTDIEILKTLENKQSENICVELVLCNDEINTGTYGLNFTQLEKLGGKVYFVGGYNNETLMHNKFCVIDNSTIISGSYNWSKKAQKNHENITIIKEDFELSKQFTLEFNSILRTYNKPFQDFTEKIDVTVLVRRLEAIKSLIQLEDEDAIVFQLSKLIKETNNKQEFVYQDRINHVVDLLKNKLFGQALNEIHVLSQELNQIVVYQDPEIPALKLELKALEFQIVSLENEKSEINKLLLQFNSKHDAELGVLIFEILKLNKEILKHEMKNNAEKEKAFQEANKEYEEFKIEHDKQKPHFEISDTEQIELKSKFRKAAMLCHPDKVSEQYKVLAQDVFNKLNEAYNSNNLSAVSDILSFLEKNNWEIKDADRPSELKKLKMLVISLRLKLRDLVFEINLIKNSDTYLTIQSISDKWDDYFATRKQMLQLKIDKLNQKLNDYGK